MINALLGKQSGSSLLDSGTANFLVCTPRCIREHVHMHVVSCMHIVHVNTIDVSPFSPPVTGGPAAAGAYGNPVPQV